MIASSDRPSWKATTEVCPKDSLGAAQVHKDSLALDKTTIVPTWKALANIFGSPVILGQRPSFQHQQSEADSKAHSLRSGLIQRILSAMLRPGSHSFLGIYLRSTTDRILDVMLQSCSRLFYGDTFTKRPKSLWRRSMFCSIPNFF